MAKVLVKTGKEGPSHDPYGWTQITFIRTDGEIVVFRYGGLGYERCIDPEGDQVDSTVDFGPECHPSAAALHFRDLTGMTPDEAESIPDRLRARRWKKMSAHERWQEEMFEEADARLLSYAM